MTINSIEQALADLEQVISRLEAGNLNSEQAAAVYHQGIDLKKFCETRLRSMRTQTSAIFFVTGFPHSGSAGLSNILDAHPQVRVSSGHSFEFFLKHLPVLIKRYNQENSQVEEKTGTDGCELLDDDDLNAMAAFIVRRMVTKPAQTDGSIIYGAKDDTIFNSIGVYAGFLDDARFIHVVRDPRDIVVSSWLFNRQVETDFADRNTSLDAWAKRVAEKWKAEVGKAAAYEKRLGDRVLPVRYEDLMDNPISTVSRVLTFINASQDVEALHSIIDGANFSASLKMMIEQPENLTINTAKDEKNNWKDQMSPDISHTVVEIAQNVMDKYLYI